MDGNAFKYKSHFGIYYLSRPILGVVNSNHAERLDFVGSFVIECLRLHLDTSINHFNSLSMLGKHPISKKSCD